MTPDQQIELYRAARSIAWSYRLQDYNAAALKDLQRIVDKSKASIIQKFADGLGQEGSYTRKHFQNNLKELERLSLGLRNQLGEQLTTSTSRIGSLALKEWGENLSVGGVAKKVNTVALSPEQFAAFFKRNPPAGILIPKVMRNALNQGVTARIEGELLDVLREGALTGQSYKRIVDKLEESFTDFNRHQLTTLTRTFFQTANAQAFDAVYQANQDIMEGKIWTNVNDDRVCLLCLPLGEVLYKKGDPHPPMPRHPNCRCVFRAKTVSYRSLGVDVDELEGVAAPVVTRGYFKPSGSVPVMSPFSEGANIFYHGTSAADFDSFDSSFLRTGADAGGKSWYGDGVYLSGEAWKGSSYAYAGPGISPRILTTKVSVRRPLIVKGTGASDFTERLKALDIPTDLDSAALTRRLKQKGFDSIVVLKNESDIVNELIVFNPSNISILNKIPLEDFRPDRFSNARLLSSYSESRVLAQPGKWIIPPAGTGTGWRPRAVSFYQGGMKEAFPDLPEAQQKAMLGVGRYNKYKAEELTLDQLADPVSGKLWLLKELDEGMHLKSVAQSNAHTIKGLTKLISEQDESKFDQELIRTKNRYKKHLKQSELYKYGLIRRKTGSGLFSILQKNGIDLSKLEEEIEEAGWRGVFSRTAGINQVYLDAKTALDIGQKNAYKKMIAELKREGYEIPM